MAPTERAGAEIEYLDFGSKDVIYVGSAGTSKISTNCKGTAVFAVGYLPLPEPWLDIYGKLGAARIKSNTTDTFTCPLCTSPSSTPNNTTGTLCLRCRRTI